MEQQEIFRLLLGWDASPSQGYPRTQQQRLEKKKKIGESYVSLQAFVDCLRAPSVIFNKELCLISMDHGFQAPSTILQWPEKSFASVIVTSQVLYRNKNHKVKSYVAYLRNSQIVSVHMNLLQSARHL